MLSANPKNAMSLYDFLLVEQIEKNVKLGTKITILKSFIYSIDFYISKTLEK